MTAHDASHDTASKVTEAAAKPSKAMSARYPNECRTCGAQPKQPCRTRATGKVTDTHLGRIDDAYSPRS